MEPSSYGEPLTPESMTAAAYSSAPPTSSAPKLSKEQAKALKQRMVVAERYYQAAFKDEFEECIKLIRGDHYQGEIGPGEHRVVVNVMPHIVETLTHSVTFEHPELIVKPQDRLGKVNAEVAEKVATYDYKKSNAHREARRAFKDSRIFNFGVLKSGWGFELEDGTCSYDDRPPVEGEAPDPDEVLKAVEEGRELPPPVPKARVRRDEFEVKRLDPRCFRVSPECSWVLDEMPWCGYDEVREVAEVKRDPRYKNTRQLKGSTKHLREYFNTDERSGWRDAVTGEEKAPEDIKRVKLMHYYEKKRRLHVVFCDEHDQPLLVEKWPWTHDRYPFRLVFMEPGEDQFYQKCPLLQLRHMQQEINHFHTQLSVHIRRFVRRYVARTKSFDDRAKKQIRLGLDGQVIETSDDPTSALVPVQDAPLSPDVYNYEAKVMQYLSLLSGIDQYEMSRAPTKRMTQDEVQAIQQSGGARGKRAAAAFETLCAEIAQDIVSWNQQYAVRARSLPVVQNGEVVDWIDWTKDEIQGEYAFEVYVGSTELKNKAGQAEELGFLLQALQPYAAAPDPMTGAPMLNIRPLIHQLLSLIPELKDVNAIVSEEPAMPMGMDPMAGPSPLEQLAAGGGAPMGLDGPMPMLPAAGGM